MSLIDCVGLNMDNYHYRSELDCVELGYSIGTESWDESYCSEAATVIPQFAFEYFSLNKITSRYSGNNNASGRDMEKLSTGQERVLKQEIYKEGSYQSLYIYSLQKHNLTVFSLQWDE